MSEVPRDWRLMKKTVNPKIEQCGNCENIEAATGRPFCRNCGLVYEPVSRRGSDPEFTSHRVRGKKLLVFFSDLPTLEETPIQVDLSVRKREMVEV